MGGPIHVFVVAYYFDLLNDVVRMIPVPDLLKQGMASILFLKNRF